jgi:hypothetical protein
MGAIFFALFIIVSFNKMLGFRGYISILADAGMAKLFGNSISVNPQRSN